MAKTGRKTKLTPKLLEVFAENIRQGASITTAAKCVGIHRSTAFDWINRGESEDEGIFSDFHDTIKKAEAELEDSIVRMVLDQVPKDWRAGITFLERRFPERWAKRSHQSIKLESEISSKEQADQALAKTFERLGFNDVN